MCRLCWELQLSISTRGRHILCTQSDNLTAGMKHRCEFHTFGHKSTQWITCRARSGNNNCKFKKMQMQMQMQIRIIL